MGKGPQSSHMHFGTEAKTDVKQKPVMLRYCAILWSKGTLVLVFDLSRPI